MNNDIVPASLAVQAMRDNGYKNAAYAIAELIDNSIQAGASVVELLCAERREQVNQRMRSRINQVAVLDNGSGMDAEVLKIALQFGNGTNLTPERQRGMGKFGMGLPSASISQCTKVEVWSWQNGPDSALYTYLDVEQIKAKQQTDLPEPILCDIPALWHEASGGFGSSGTLIVWSNLDRIFWKTAASIIDNSELLVGRMYRRFLADARVRIRLAAFDVDSPVLTMTERDVLPNDPLYLTPRTSCPAPFDNEPMFEPWGGEYYAITYQIAFRGETHPVTLRFAVAKSEARPGRNPGAQPHGQHAAKNVGVSIVRADRELDLDQAWTIQYDPVERWWGVEVEFPPALDEVFGVTNNKQAARNFAELSKLDFDLLLKGGRSIGEVMEELIMDGDPRAPLLEIAQRIRTNLSELRKWLTRQSQQKSAARTTRHDGPTPEAVATSVTRELQREGHTGTSDRDETLPAPERQHAIEQTLVEAGVPQEEAEGLAATTISEGYKYLFTYADLDTPAFFTVKMKGGGIQIILNSEHPAYRHLVTVLDSDVKTDDPAALRERLNRASDGLKLLLSAWARYEDEQPDGQLRSRAQQTRSDWGSMARRFLEREE
jgi:hypothetical protein